MLGLGLGDVWLAWGWVEVRVVLFVVLCDRFGFLVVLVILRFSL